MKLRPVIVRSNIVMLELHKTYITYADDITMVVKIKSHSSINTGCLMNKYPIYISNQIFNY